MVAQVTYDGSDMVVQVTYDGSDMVAGRVCINLFVQVANFTA